MITVMNPVLRNLLAGIVGALVLGAGFYFFFIQSSGGLENGQPSLQRPYVITAELPEEAKTILRSNVEKITAELKESPDHFETWFELAIHYKIAGDFEGARQVWEYLAVSAPSNMHYVALGNLGDLYMNFIKDYPKAEEYYKKAIALSPGEISFYTDLFRLYYYLYKTDTSAAADIVEEGLRLNPGNTDLLNLETQLKEGK